METVEKRLHAAIEQRRRRGEGGLRKLSRELSERKVRGSSIPSIYRYLKGEGIPPVEFLEAAAETLCVRYEWLRHGEGERERSAADIYQQVEDESAGECAENMQHALMNEFIGFVQLSRFARLAVLEATVYQWSLASRDPERFTDCPVTDDHAGLERMAGLVGKGMESLLRCMDIDADRVPFDQLNSFAVAVAQGLMTVNPPISSSGSPMTPMGISAEALETSKRNA